MANSIRDISALRMPPQWDSSLQENHATVLLFACKYGFKLLYEPRKGRFNVTTVHVSSPNNKVKSKPGNQKALTKLCQNRMFQQSTRQCIFLWQMYQWSQSDLSKTNKGEKPTYLKVYLHTKERPAIRYSPLSR